MSRSEASLFQAALGADWSDLPKALQSFHHFDDQLTLTGTGDVVRGRGPVAAVAAALFRLPRAGRNIPVTVRMTRTARGETWVRQFADRSFTSYLLRSESHGHFRERFGALTCDVALENQDGTIRMPVSRGWLFGILLPKWSLPTSDTKEFAAEDTLYFDVSLCAPLNLGLIVRYRGALRKSA